MLNFTFIRIDGRSISYWIGIRNIFKSVPTNISEVVLISDERKKYSEDASRSANGRKSEKKSLEDLIIKEESIAKEILYDVLKDHVRFTDRGSIMFVGSSKKLPHKEKILLVLLARKALYILGKADTEEMSPKEISETIGIHGGIVRSVLSALKKEGLVSSPKRGSWRINWSKFDEIKELLED